MAKQPVERGAGRPEDDGQTLEQPPRRLESGVRRTATRAPVLVVTHLDRAWVVRPVEGRALVVGRDPEADISVVDPSVSRSHARIECVGDAVTVTDLGSTNGTLLNGLRVEQATLGLGDEVCLGNVTLTLHARPEWSGPREHPLSHDQFLAVLEDEVERGLAFRRGLAVVMVHFDDPSVGVAALRPRLRTVDRFAHFGRGDLEILLPEADRSEVDALLERTGARAGIAFFPRDGGSADALIQASRAALRQTSASAPVQIADRAPREREGPLVVASPAMRGILDLVERAATAVIPVLIRGETGTGKEVLARSIHERGPRAQRPFSAINCAAIPPTLLESVLFGHEAGAFTGAQRAQAGVFEEADGGTVFLDEIGELTLAAQAALLRVLETRQVRRIGGKEELKLDVRILSATHRDLEAMVQAGSFREDLYYRLNTLMLEVPPLRERPEEIGPLAEHFLALANAANGRAVTAIGAEAMHLLLVHPWPGNIRELRNAIEHAVVVAKGPVIQPEDLSRRTRAAAAAADSTLEDEPDHAEANPPTGLREQLAAAETQIILEALRATDGNRTKAARRLHVPVRSLSHRIRVLGIKKLGFGTDPAGD